MHSQLRLLVILNAGRIPGGVGNETNVGIEISLSHSVYWSFGASISCLLRPYDPLGSRDYLGYKSSDIREFSQFQTEVNESQSCVLLR